MRLKYFAPQSPVKDVSVIDDKNLVVDLLHSKYREKPTLFDSKLPTVVDHQVMDVTPERDTTTPPKFP